MTLQAIGNKAEMAIQFAKGHVPEIQTGCVIITALSASMIGAFFMPEKKVTLAVLGCIGMIAIPAIIKSVKWNNELQAEIHHRLRS